MMGTEVGKGRVGGKGRMGTLVIHERTFLYNGILDCLMS